MQWNKQELLGIINQGPKAIIKNIIPYLDNKENNDIEKETILRKISSVIVNNKYKLAFAEKEYLFNYFRNVYIKGADIKRIGLDDVMLSKLMADKEINEETKEDAQQYLEHNRNIAIFSKELDEIYGFCENVSSKLIHHDISHLANIVERCMSRIAIDKKPKGVLVALELVNLNQMKSAINILIELAKKGRATEMTSFLHRILPKINGAEAMILKILKLNLQQSLQDDVITGNTEIKEYILYAYLNAVEVFTEANYVKAGGELLNELYVKDCFLGARALICSKFSNIANKIMVLDFSQKTTLLAIAQKLNLKIYNENNTISFGKEIKTQPIFNGENINDINKNTVTPATISPIEVTQSSVIEIDKEATIDGVIEVEKSAENISETIDNIEKIIEENKEEIQDIKNIDVEAQNVIEGSNNKESKLVEEIIETVHDPVDVVDTASNNEEITGSQSVQKNTTEENVVDVEVVLQKEGDQDKNNEDDAFLEILNRVSQEYVVTENNPAEVKEIEVQVEDTQLQEPVIEETINQERFNENASASVENIEDKQDDENKINLSNILNISQADIDKHFEKIKNITMAANEKAEKIKERVENMDFSNSKSVEKIKDIAKKISVFKWKK